MFGDWEPCLDETRDFVSFGAKGARPFDLLLNGRCSLASCKVCHLWSLIGS